jgi:hypothetical protein
LPAVAGLVLTTVALFLPWETLHPDLPMAREVRTGIASFSATVAEVLLFGVGTLLLGASRSVDGSRSRLVQTAPAFAGLAALFVTVARLRAMGVETSDLAGVVDPGFWLYLLGSALIAIGGASTSVALARQHPIPAGGWRPSMDRTLLSALLSSGIGIVASVAITEYLSTGNSQVAYAAPFLIIVGAVLLDRLRLSANNT